LNLGWLPGVADNGLAEAVGTKPMLDCATHLTAFKRLTAFLNALTTDDEATA
jgi:hypothetical protein